MRLSLDHEKVLQSWLGTLIMGNLLDSLTASNQALADGNLYYNSGQFARAKQHYDRAHILGASHKTAYSLALVHSALGRSEKAIEFYETALRMDPFFLEARVNYGSILRDNAKLETARHQHTVAYGLAPSHPATQLNLGLTYVRRREFALARHLIGLARAQAPDLKAAEQAAAKLPPMDAPHPDWNLTDQTVLGDIGAGRDQEAVARLEAFLADHPHSALGWTDLGAALIRLGRAAEALPALERSRAIKPDQAPVYHNLGSAHVLLGHVEEAIESYYRALACNPALSESWRALSELFVSCERQFEAWEALLPSAQFNPPNVELLIAFAERSRKIRRMDVALKTMKDVGSVLPDSFVVHNNSGTFYLEDGRMVEAIAAFEKAAELEPNSALVAGNLGASYEIVQRYTDALREYARASALSPDNRAFTTRRMHVAQHLCLWDDIDSLFSEIASASAGDLAEVQPFGLLSVPGVSAAVHRDVAISHAQRHFPDRHAVRPVAKPSGRYRIAYLSSDFHDHPTSWLIVELLELHDRAKFEVFTYCSSPKTSSPIAKRIRDASDHFQEIHALSDERAADLIAGDRIDILIDVKGYTLHTRSGILGYRPAPIQINYLAYPGTMGAPYVDYIIGDPVVIPPEFDHHYTETVLRLPHCYQPNDRKRPRPPAPFREAAGLPARGFVFCSFNNAYKVTPEVFSSWCRVLAATPGSVLWFLTSTPQVADNLRKEAARRGIDPDRLVFAPRLVFSEHLARYQLADLVLDTFPYTAHTTASDALWCGVPVVTCLGETFASRVAASILTAAGMRDLVTTTMAEYEALTLSIANDPLRHAELRRRIEEQRMVCPLFDTPRYTADLEALYAECIASRAARG
jgi:protein O-GlcNAc transferase